MTNLHTLYSARYAKALKPIAERLEVFIQECLSDVSRIDRIVARAKSIDRFLAKAEKEKDGLKKYSDPLNQIQDQVGARIITFYPDDVAHICKAVEKYFHPIEEQTVVPDTDAEFGYFGKHYILLLPRDVIDPQEPTVPQFFELQIKTLFQHAWSEANHDLGYKPDGELDSHFRRRLAFTSAQAWGADQIFNELQREIAQQSQPEATSETAPSAASEASDG
jgi:ppGpp synthetase/RelA/SpoT-type nucleotidyltranferase